MKVLRPYQRAAVDVLKSKVDSHPILVAPTGSGKTVMGVAAATELGGRTLWVAHRRELIRQAFDAVQEAGGDAGMILAGEPERDAPFQVASVQTLARRSVPYMDLLVIDEAHHATGGSYRALIARFGRRIGLTATPFRLDGKGLREAGFDDIVVAAYTDDLCADGTLHEPTVYAAPPPDLRSVKKTAGDYNLGALGDAVRAAGLDGKIVDTWQKRAAGKRTVAFAVDIAHGQQIVSAFRAAGVEAEIVTGATPKIEREAVLARLAHGITKIVVNCQVLTEGWDLPALECAIMARPTASLCLHLQMIGRIMRACDGKDGAIVLDHAGNYGRHGLVTDRLVYSLDGKVKKATGVAPTKSCPECAKVIPAGKMTCPECGYVFPAKDPTIENDVELLPVGHGDDFAERQRRWDRFWKDGQRIAAWQAKTLFAEGSTDRGYAIAAAKYKTRYGKYPLAIGPTLVNPETATPYDWDRLRARWRQIGEGKGWTGAKVAWFIKKCEAEAKNEESPALVVPFDKCSVRMDDGRYCRRPRLMPHSYCAAHKLRRAEGRPMGTPIENHNKAVAS